jgi:hypothetical protein
MEKDFNAELQLRVDAIRSASKDLLESGYKFTEEESVNILSDIREVNLLLDEYEKIK